VIGRASSLSHTPLSRRSHRPLSRRSHRPIRKELASRRRIGKWATRVTHISHTRQESRISVTRIGTSVTDMHKSHANQSHLWQDKSHANQSHLSLCAYRLELRGTLTDCLWCMWMDASRWAYDVSTSILTHVSTSIMTQVHIIYKYTCVYIET